MSIIFINPYRFAAYDTDAQAYITAVEAADGQSLETAVKDAINAFVVGCKADGIWSAIKASCILAGARTLSGALVPLVGTAPTNFNFVAGDYNRKTGLVGNGSTKYLNSNRNNNADPQNSKHASVYVSTLAGNGPNGSTAYLGGANASGSTQLIHTSQTLIYRVNTSVSNINTGITQVAGLIGLNRASSSTSSIRNNKTTATVSDTSASPTNENILLYRRADTAFVTHADARIAFYSLGESLDLALLDSRVTTLINAIAAAIP